MFTIQTRRKGSESEMSATNAMNALGDIYTHGTSIGYPAMLGLLGIGVGIGLVVWILKRGKKAA